MCEHMLKLKSSTIPLRCGCVSNFLRAFELRTVCIQLVSVAQDCYDVRGNAFWDGGLAFPTFFACVESRSALKMGLRFQPFFVHSNCALFASSWPRSRKIAITFEQMLLRWGLAFPTFFRLRGNSYIPCIWEAVFLSWLAYVFAHVWVASNLSSHARAIYKGSGTFVRVVGASL